MRAEINHFNIKVPVYNKLEDVAIYTIQIETVGKADIATT